MSTTLYVSSRLSAKAGAVAKEGVEDRDQPCNSASTGTRRILSTRVGLRPPVHAELIIRQDDEAVSSFFPSCGAGGSLRAAVAVGHAHARLTAALAFFHSRSSSRLAVAPTGRLRV